MNDHRYLAVDRRNLFSWLSRGLIVPRTLMDKYRPDALASAEDTLPIASAPAVGRLCAAAEYPVAIELAAGVTISLGDREIDGPVALARGAVSARRVARVHVRTAADVDEIRARAYRGFDGSELDIASTPTLFEVQAPEADAAQVFAESSGVQDDLVLKRREAVAGAVMSMFSGESDSVSFPDGWLAQNEADDPILSLVQAAKAAGLINRQDDFELLHLTLLAIYDQSGEGDVVPSALIAQIGESVIKSTVPGIDKHLQRIMQLTQGEDDLKPFKVHGGLLTTKALLLYLLRPDPEAVRGWSNEDLNAESEVLQLSRLLAGFASRYSGLPSTLRVSDGVGELLDWTARGLQPSDFVISAEETATVSVPATSFSMAGSTNPAVDALRSDVAAGEYKQALSLAQALGWSNCLQLQVTAPSFEATTAGEEVHCTFAPGAVLGWSLLEDTFIDRLSGLSDSDLQAAFKPKRSAGRRASAKATADSTGRARKKSSDPVEDPAQTSAEGEGPGGATS